jgi:gamma-glutamylcyclotransferase (GGCT)/AIG2-like uncharacterized protein YtfP
MAEQLFVYGTLKDPAVQQAVFGRVVEGRPESLEGYSTKPITIGGTVYLNLWPDPDGSVEGLVIEVAPQELALIDRYEGDDYQRIQVTLTSRKVAWVYRAAG